MKNEVEEKAEEYGQMVAEGTGIIDFKHVSTNAYMDGYNEAMRWRDPKDELPKINSRMLLKSETGYVETRTIRNWHILGNSLSLVLGGKKVIGWRPIENKNHFEGRIEEAGCDFCRDEQGYTIGNMYVCDKCGRQVP